MEENRLLEPNLDDKEFAKALWFRYVDSRYFAQRGAAEAGNQLANRAFDLLESQQWEQAWQTTRTDTAQACLNAPLASPFSSVIGNRINFLFVRIVSLTQLVRDNIVSEMTEPLYARRLDKVLKRAVRLDYQQYVKWGITTPSRFENLRDAATTLVNPNPMDDVFGIRSSENSYWDGIKSMAGVLREKMDVVLSMDRIGNER